MQRRGKQCGVRQSTHPHATRHVRLRVDAAAHSETGAEIADRLSVLTLSCASTSSQPSALGWGVMGERESNCQRGRSQCPWHCWERLERERAPAAHTHLCPAPTRPLDSVTAAPRAARRRRCGSRSGQMSVAWRLQRVAQGKQESKRDMDVAAGGHAPTIALCDFDFKGPHAPAPAEG
eukprot:scaffold28499_cov101-Isochrysis_galbana.AAC.1